MSSLFLTDDRSVYFRYFYKVNQLKKKQLEPYPVYRASGFGKLKIKIIMSKVRTFSSFFEFENIAIFGAKALHLGSEDPLPSQKVLDRRQKCYVI